MRMAGARGNPVAIMAGIALGFTWHLILCDAAAADVVPPVPRGASCTVTEWTAQIISVFPR